MVSYVMRATRALLHPSIRAGRVGRRSMMTIGDKIKAKEKVEEDRYMRAQEEEWKEKLRQLKAKEWKERSRQVKAQEEHQRELAQYEAVIKPVMSDVAKILEGTGDNLSDEGLEKLSKWKLDL